MTETATTPTFMVPDDISRLRQVADPQVSPTGSAVAFTVSDPDLESNTYRRQIWLTPTDLTQGHPYPLTAHGHEVLPRWSPDGRQLAFVSRDPDPEQYGSPGQPRDGKDMPPRRVTRLLYRLNAAGWT